MRSSFAGEFSGKSFLFMAGIIVLVVACFAVYPLRVGSIANSLRGGGILIVDIPRQDGGIERIDVSEQQFATRTFYPIQHPRAYSKIDLPDAVWRSLKQLQQEWCAKSPTFRPTPEQMPVYSVAMQCQRAANPVFRIPSDQLPQPLGTLLSVVPSPPEVRDGTAIETQLP
jgi:hypothetical protein